MGIPKLKRKVTDFLIGEEGSISKDKLLKTGIVIAGVAVSAEAAMAWTTPTHTNDCTGSPNAAEGTTVHANVIKLTKDISSEIDGNHCNGSSTTHASHGSHGSHTAW